MYAESERVTGTSTERYLRDDSASRSLHERALQVMPGGNSRHTLVMDP